MGSEVGGPRRFRCVRDDLRLHGDIGFLFWIAIQSLVNTEPSALRFFLRFLLLPFPIAHRLKLNLNGLQIITDLLHILRLLEINLFLIIFSLMVLFLADIDLVEINFIFVSLLLLFLS